MPRYWWEEPEGYEPAADPVVDPRENSFEFVEGDYAEAEQAELAEQDGGQTLWEDASALWQYWSKEATIIPWLAFKAVTLPTEYMQRDNAEAQQVLSAAEIKEEFGTDVDGPMTRIQASHQAMYQRKMEEVDRNWEKTSNPAVAVLSFFGAIASDPINFIAGGGAVRAAKLAYQAAKRVGSVSKATSAAAATYRAQQAVKVSERGAKFAEHSVQAAKAGNLGRQAVKVSDRQALAGDVILGLGHEAAIQELHKREGYDSKAGWAVYGAAAMGPVALRFLGKLLNKGFAPVTKQVSKSRLKTYKDNLLDLGKRAADNRVVSKASRVSKNTNDKLLDKTVAARAKEAEAAATSGIRAQATQAVDGILRAAGDTVPAAKAAKALKITKAVLDKVESGKQVKSSALIKELDAKLKAQAGLPKATLAQIKSAVKMATDVVEGMKGKPLTKMRALEQKIAAQEEMIIRSQDNNYKLFAEDNLANMKLERDTLHAKALYQTIPAKPSALDMHRVLSQSNSALVRKQIVDNLAAKPDVPDNVKVELEAEAAKLEAVGYLQARFGKAFDDQIAQVKMSLQHIGSEAKLDDLLPYLRNIEDTKKMVDDLKFQRSETGAEVYRTDAEIVDDLMPVDDDFLPKVMEGTQSDVPPGKMNRGVESVKKAEQEAVDTLNKGATSTNAAVREFSAAAPKVKKAIKEYTQCLLGGTDG